MAKTKKKAARRSAAPARGRTTGAAKTTAARAKPRRAKAAKKTSRTAKAPAAARGRTASSTKKAAPSARKATPARRPTAVKAAPKRSPAPQRAKKAAPARNAAAKNITARRPNLDRARRTVREEEEMVPSPPSSLNMDRTASSARSGGRELAQKLRDHTSTGPAMTGGDVDADWEDAEAVGDEAPGGDSPTPDQDVVDEIGKALGVEYDDDEELQGGDEIVARDRKRWELDPASKDDFEEE